MDLAIVGIAFVLVFPAELPDKTALASLMLGTRYRALHVFVGVAAAFAVHVVLAITAGSLLALLPKRPLQAVVAVLFLLGAVLLLRGRHEPEDEHVELKGRRATFGRVAWTSFVVILVAEFGDLTQILTANLAAHYHDPVSVGLGSVVALWAVAGLAIVGGRNLLRVIPLKIVIMLAAAAMAVLAVISLIRAIRG